MIKRNTEMNEEALKMMLQKEQAQVQLTIVEAQREQQTPEVTTNQGVVDLEELRREQAEYELAL